MAKNSITDYDNIANNNTDIQSVDIAEGCAPSGINNAIREMMADLADVNDGTVTLTSPKAATLDVTGNLTVDTNTLYVDSTNNRVGIGTSSPVNKLDVVSHTADGRIAMRTQNTSGSAMVEAQVNNYWSGPTYSGTSIRQYDTAATGSTAGISNANSGQLAFQNTSHALIYTNGSTPISFATASVERMRIDSSGNLLIGSSSLSFDNVSKTVIRQVGDNWTIKPYICHSFNRTDSDGSILEFYKSSSLVGSIGTASGGLTFGSGSSGTERMRIDSSGSLRLGTTGNEGVLNRLTVKYTGGGSEYGMVMKPAADNTVPIYFQNASGGNVGTISTSSTATSYNTSSDHRLKEDLQPMTGATERVKALNPVNFAWKVDGSRVDGFLAHEAQEVVPEAVSGEKDAMREEEYEVTPAVLDEDGNVVTEAVMGTRQVPDYQGIDQSKLVPLLTAALQEAIAKIETLEVKVAALENA